MAKYSNTEYIDFEPERVLGGVEDICEFSGWKLLQMTENSVSVREGLLGWLSSGPATINIRVSTVKAGDNCPEGIVTSPTVGATRVDSDLSCMGLGPINKRRLKKVESQFIVAIVQMINKADEVFETLQAMADGLKDEEQQDAEQGSFCTSCGEPLDDGVKFCGSCGASV